MTDAVLLDDRSVVEIIGSDAAKFLHNLVTNDMLKLGFGEARFCALLTPQGKIIVDFLAFAQGEGETRSFLLDCPKSLVDELVRRLGMYKLRAAVTIALRADLAAYGFLDAGRPQVDAKALARDPRAEALGWRALAPLGAIEASARRADYEARRVAAGVPQGGVDFAYGEAFPHEANMDLLSGVDFKKGCYVGQEVVARMKHRGLARKRVARYRAHGAAPAAGAAIVAGEKEIGVTGSNSGDSGLALIRLDRLEEALAAGAAPHAAGVRLKFSNLPG
ncbi:MAG TPA: folate-binding protein [Methylocystis sp.]|nr:folate-binding protein [Methylocystis sp.]